METRAGLIKMRNGPPIDIGQGLFGPEWLDATLDPPDLPYVVTIKASFTGDRYEITDLHCRQRAGEGSVTGEGIRQLPVGDMLTYGVLGSVAAMNSELVEKRPVRPQITDDGTLAHVAKLYRLAYVTQEDPARAVMDNLKLPRATAGRWIRRARDRGFLSDVAPHRPKGGTE